MEGDWVLGDLSVWCWNGGFVRWFSWKKIGEGECRCDGFILGAAFGSLFFWFLCKWEMKTRMRVVQVQCRKTRNGDFVALVMVFVFSIWKQRLVIMDKVGLMVSCVLDGDDDVDSNEFENEKWWWRNWRWGEGYEWMMMCESVEESKQNNNNAKFK